MHGRCKNEDYLPLSTTIAAAAAPLSTTIATSANFADLAATSANLAATSTAVLAFVHQRCDSTFYRGR